MKPRLSNWREESDLYEVVTGKMTDKEALKKVDEKKGINNKVIINPKLSEAIDELGGEVVSVDEALAPSKKEINIMKKVNLLQLRLQKEKRKTTAAAEQAAKQKDDIEVQQEDYETQKKGEVLKALDKKKFVKRYGKDKAPDIMYAVAAKTAKKKGDTSKSDDRYAYEEFESIVEYFYKEGINEEGLEQIIEEIGLDDFVDFVDDSVQVLSEERAARKMNVRTKGTIKKQIQKDAAAEAKRRAEKKGEYAEKPKRKAKIGGPSYATKVKQVLKKKAAAKKVAPKKPAAPRKPVTTTKPVTPKKPAAPKKPVTKKVAKKDFDGDGKKESPRAEYTGSRNKKITKAVAKVKKTQPAKKASKEGLRAKIRTAYKKGVERHKAATKEIKKTVTATAKQHAQHRKDFVKGATPTAREKKIAGGVAKAAKKALTRESLSNWKEEILSEVKVTRLGDAQQKAMQDAILKRKEDLKKKEKVKVKEEVVLEKDLSAAERRALPNKDFALPGKGEGPKGKQAGSYPIPDEKHARSALSLVSQHGTPEEKATVRAKVKKKFPNIDVSEAKVDTGSPEAKASARNKRNTPPGKDYKFDTSVFITRKSGESLDSARTRKRREAHSKKRGMKEDRALDIVRANIIKKHGKGAIYDPKNPPKAQPRPKSQPQKPLTADEKAEREIDAQYGGRANRLAGRGLGT